MTTDRELDVLLAGARGVRDADLPALPESFLDVLTAGVGLPLVTDGTPGEPASVVAARQLVADARDARTAARPRRLPRRRMAVRLATAAVAIAAAWVTAVVVAPQDGAPGRPAPSTAGPGVPAVPGGIELVAAEAVTFPLSLDPVPEGLMPSFSRRGGVPGYGSTPPFFVADHSSDGGDRVLLGVYPEDPRSSADYGFWHEGDPTGTVTVDGAPAAVWQESGLVSLLWQRRDDQWVQLSGEGAQASVQALVRAGESIVDRPSPVGLQFGLAPAGWSVGGYEESRSLDLLSDTDPDLLLRVSLLGPEVTGPLDDLVSGYPTAAPVESVTVQGRPARLALRDAEAGDDWFLVGQLTGGRYFTLAAPQELTREQVLQVAEKITYTP